MDATTLAAYDADAAAYAADWLAQEPPEDMYALPRAHFAAGPTAEHPTLRFDEAALPGLDGLERGAFQNVPCETVVMHLEPAQVGPSVHGLLALLKPGGVLYLSWRATDDASKRDPAGRLYAAFDKARVADALAPGDAIPHDEERASVSSGKRVQRRIVRRRPGDPLPR